MISEIDLRDWEYVDIEKAREMLEDFDAFARMSNVIPTGQYGYFRNLLDQIELFQQKTLKQIPKLFQNWE